MNVNVNMNARDHDQKGNRVHKMSKKNSAHTKKLLCYYPKVIVPEYSIASVEYE